MMFNNDFLETRFKWYALQEIEIEAVCFVFLYKISKNDQRYYLTRKVTCLVNKQKKNMN